MPERLLRNSELVGPDVLRPGSKYGHLGHGEVAFIATKFKDDQGRRFFAYPATRGHESFITDELILQAMFGPALPSVREEFLFTHDEYIEVRDEFGGTRYEPSGRKKQSWDWIALRQRAEVQNLFGRLGTVRGRRVLMLWNQPEDWLDLLRITVAELSVPPEAILTAGLSELGLVKDFVGEVE